MLKKNKILMAFILLAILILAFGSILYKPALSLTYLKSKYANDQSVFITIDETTIHYRDEGAGDVILLLHGTAASLHTWDNWTKELSKTYRVIRLDLPAYGLTGPFKDNNYQMSHYTNLLENFLRQLKVENVIIAGNSLGGQIALNFALSNQNMVSKLILLNSAGLPRQQASPLIFRLAKNKLGSSLLKNALPKFIIHNNLKAVYYNDELISNEMIDRYYELALREGNRKAFIERIKTKNTPFTKSQLQNLKVKTLILWGKQDEWIPVENASLFDDYIPHSQLVIFNDAGHIPMEEIPQESLDVSLRFLNN